MQWKPVGCKKYIYFLFHRKKESHQVWNNFCFCCWIYLILWSISVQYGEKGNFSLCHGEKHCQCRPALYPQLLFSPQHCLNMQDLNQPSTSAGGNHLESKRSGWLLSTTENESKQVWFSTREEGKGKKLDLSVFTVSPKSQSIKIFLGGLGLVKQAFFYLLLSFSGLKCG